ncbi:NADH:flavin oxidoreductase/NADH oxidase [Sphingobacterium wenxiniae]|uniref:2,4-dienoyl-CoA reductase n=1 Tax=Sphingobacterium wenxiniae TaxID=683125 RepID=A0A1I6PXC2_9SPHI|nr:NADH:flavin oxidoreductase/NADH oxidase [Sphingobacterium wenxiniae]SFS44700.1 2,4-dienoyl-CoA reductase [Sphingobacterium wenxiniae]
MKHLFSPLRLRDMTLKNRIALSPMQQYSAVDGIPGQWHLVHLGSRAVGGAGLILTECTAISPEAMCTLYDTGIWNEAQVAGWKFIVDFVHQQGAKMGVQLWHAGGKASSKHPNEGMKPLPLEEGGWIPKSSSATPINAHHPQAMTLQEIQEVKNQFAQAAKNAIKAGFDTIELHAAHGYLLHQFYSGLINKRTDEYGGSFENRIRLLVEVVNEVRNTIPDEMPLLVRLSAVDYSNEPEAWTLADSLKLTEILKDSGVDLITASGGGFVQVDPSIVKPNYQLPLATAIRESANMPVGTVGMITDAHQANAIIENSEADLIVIAREHLRNPYFAVDAAIELGQTPDVPWQYKRAY